MINNFLQAIFNVFVFLPYFFSVPTLFRTLFAPWKNLTVTPKENQSLSDSMSNISFNLVSRCIGFTMRTSMLGFYVFVQTFLILALPLIILLFIVLLPFLNFKKSLIKTPEEKKAKLKQKFVVEHTLKPENSPKVEEWFDNWYKSNIDDTDWWELKHLFSLPPLARDWAAGYTPTLDSYTEELTAPSYMVNRGHLVGREKELALIERALSKSAEANIIISGPEGVGKHTIVDALAKKIYEGQINVLLMYKRVLQLNLEKIFATEIDLKKREDLLNNLFAEALAAQNVILVIDDIDRYVSNGDGRIDITASIEKYAKASNLHFLGITTPHLYQEFLAANPIMERLFTKIEVDEIPLEDAYQVMLEAAIQFENRHEINIPYETIKEAVEKSEHFITNIPFPEKALQLLDEACIEATKKKLKQVLPEHIDRVLNERTHIPVTLTQDLKLRLLQLESILRQDIVNQEEAVDQVANGLRRAFILIGKRKKPLASFLFLGPTGVGKTATAKSIAKVFFESQAAFIRFDMSLYQSKEDISKLLGSQNDKTPGLLTATLRENPYGVLLLDELEKANRDLLNIFLTVLDEGYYTDGYGNQIDCKNLIIIATSNAGADFLYRMQKTKTQKQISQDEVIDFLIQNRVYTPEFLNRFDAIVVYQPLSTQSAVIVAKSMLNEVLEQIYSLYKVKVNVSDQTLEKIVSDGYKPAFGARTMERALRVSLEDSIAKKILANEVKEGDTISL